MATTNVCLQEESILKLVLGFLTGRKYYKSARSLEKETGILANPLSDSLLFFRDLVLDGDWSAVREFGEPLADLPTFEYRRFNFLVAKQEYFEILFEKCEENIKDEQALRDRLLTCLQDLEKYCTLKDEYNKLYWYLSVPSLRTEPEFCHWSVDSSRMTLFEEMLDLLKQFIPIGQQNVPKSNVASEDRLLSLLFKGSLYENCIEFCQKQAMGRTAVSDYSLTNVNVDLFRKQSLKSTGNFYSWLHSLSKESFVVPFEELNFDLQVEKQRSTRVTFDAKNNTLSRSLTIELKSPSKHPHTRGRDERRKQFFDFPHGKPAMLDFDVREVSQSFAEFEFAENGNERLLDSKDQDVFLENGEIWPEATGGHTSNVSPKAMAAPRKARRDQQDLILQQLEEHKQRQQELYKQLAESASLARGSGMIKDTRPNDTIPDKSSTTKSLEAVKKSIQNLKLLTENYECPKESQSDKVFSQFDVNDSQGLKIGEKGNNERQSPQPCPSTINIPNEMLARKSSSSTPGSAALPKTPVNTCLPPGLVKLTDGSGTFNTSTPKAEHQSFTTPLPASPVTTEQGFSRNNPPSGQCQQRQRNLSVEANVLSDRNVQTPKAATCGTTSGTRQFTSTVRRSLVNTVFQNEYAACQTVETKEKVGIDLKDLRNQVPTASAMRDDPTDSRFQAISSVKNADEKTDSQFLAKAETNPKNSRSSNYSTRRNPNSIKDSYRPVGSDPKDPRLQHISSIRNTSSAINSQPSAVKTVSHTERTLQSTKCAPLNFQRSAMLADTQAIRAVVFHPSGKYFAVGTNSKALKLCRMRNKNDYLHSERNEQDTSKLEVVCQKSSIHKGSVYCVAFSSNGDIIATGSNDKTIKILRFNENNPLNLEDKMDLTIHNATVRDLTFVNTAAGGHPVLASGGAGGGLIQLSDCFTGQTISSLQGHAGNIMAVFASNQAHLLCSGSADKTVRLWDLRLAKSIDVIATSSCVTSVCFNYGTTHSLLLASADDSGQCIVYDVGARKSITSFNPHEMDCRSIRFSPDSKYILTGSYDASVAITAVQYNNSEMLSDSRVIAQHRDKVIQCRWHPSEYSFLSSSADKTVVLWQQTMR